MSILSTGGNPRASLISMKSPRFPLIPVTGFPPAPPPPLDMIVSSETGHRKFMTKNWVFRKSTTNKLLFALVLPYLLTRPFHNQNSENTRRQNIPFNPLWKQKYSEAKKSNLGAIRKCQKRGTFVEKPAMCSHSKVHISFYATKTAIYKMFTQ